MARAGSGRAEGVLLAEFGVVIRHFAHQALGHRFAIGVVEARSQLGHHLGDSGDDLVGIDSVRLVVGDGIFGVEVVDDFDQQAVQARPIVVEFFVV
jgi:hypothetical protein